MRIITTPIRGAIWSTPSGTSNEQVRSGAFVTNTSHAAPVPDTLQALRKMGVWSECDEGSYRAGSGEISIAATPITSMSGAMKSCVRNLPIWTRIPQWAVWVADAAEDYLWEHWTGPISADNGWRNLY